MKVKRWRVEEARQTAPPVPADAHDDATAAQAKGFKKTNQLEMSVFVMKTLKVNKITAGRTVSDEVIDSLITCVSSKMFFLCFSFR